MKKIFYFKSLLSLLLLFVGINAWGSTYTITFAKADSDNNTAMTTETAASDVISAGAEYVTGFVTCTNVYNNSISGLKIGKSKAAGTFEFTLADACKVNVTSITIKSARYGSDTGGLILSNGSTQLTTDIIPGVDFTYSFDTPTTLESISLATSAKRAYVSEIVITTKDSNKTTTATSFPENSYTAYLTESFTAPTATVKANVAEVSGATITYASDNESVATVNASTGAVTLVAPGTTKITASYAGDDTYDASSASYTLKVGKVYASLADLVADGEPTGIPVKVTLTDEVIQSIYTTKSGYRNGIFLKSGEQEVEIYCQNVPEGWEANGTVSGTITGDWKLYSSTWEICPADWTQLTYTGPSKDNPTISATYNKSLEAGTTDTYTVTYDGDGTLSVTSSDETVATVSISGTTVTVTPLAAGTTKITISATETANYNAASMSYTLTVTEPATPVSIPFAFDGGKADIANYEGMSQTGLGSDYSASPKLKFDGTGDNLVIHYAETAKYLYYTIKGNSFSDGTFDVMESADGTEYTTVKSYTVLDGTITEICDLNSSSRYVKFVYTEKSAGNVALGAIEICNEKLQDNVPISSVGYATYYNSKHAYIMPEGCEGWVAYYNNGFKFEQAYSGGDVVPAGVALVLKATTSDYSIVYTNEVGEKPSTKNYLAGTDEETELTDKENYYFYALSLDASNDVESVGFYWMNSTGAAFTNGAHKAYLTVSKSNFEDESEAKGFAFEDVTDGISTVGANETDSTVYNLAGQRVNANAKGILIKNGHKFINK